MPLVLDISNLQQSVASQGNFKNNMNLSFFNRKQGPTMFSLRSGVGMMASDLPDLITKVRPSGPTGPNWNLSTNNDAITMRVTDTTLVERLRVYEPVQTTSRKLLCLEQAVTGDDGMARYNVRWTDSRELDVSGATGPVINSTSKATGFGLIYTYDHFPDPANETGAKYKIRFNNDDPSGATDFYIGTLDDDDPHNDVSAFLSTWK